LLVASAVLAARPASELRFYNRGISGNKVPDLQQRWTADTVNLHPDVLSILIGVNDFWHKLDHGYNGTVQDYEQQYTALLAETRSALPGVHMIVLEPFVLRTGALAACADLKDMLSLQRGLAQEFQTEAISININNSVNMTILFSNSPVAQSSDSEQSVFAHRVGEFVRDHYPKYDELQTIAVGF